MKTILSLAISILLFTGSSVAQQWNYAARYGGGVAGFSDAAKAVCTDASGNIYVTGNFNSSINFGNGTPTLTPTAGGTQTEGFVAKFNPAGLCQWAMDFGGAAADQGGLGIITDGTTVYITGQSQFPSTVGSLAPMASVGGSTDGIVFALNASTGAAIWARAFGGGVTGDMGQAICMDNLGRVYISGIFSTRTANPTASFGTAGSFPRTVQGNMTQTTSDLFVAQIDPASGNFNWVSTGGAASQATPLIVGNDNINGGGIAFVPSLNQLVVTGSFASATATYYSNGSATPSVTLTNVGQADICVLKLDLSGNFLSGLSAGGANPDEGLTITYDATTTDVYIAGYFNSASVAGAFSLTNTATGFDEIYYARYNPTANTFTWARSAGGSAGGNDFAVANTVNKTGVFVTGRFQGNISFPGTTPLAASSSAFDDVFLVKLDPANGNAIQLATGSGAGAGTDAGFDVAVSTNNDVWVVGVFGSGTVSFLPSSPAISVTAGSDQELFMARYNDPPPVITAEPAASTVCRGLAAGFNITAAGNALVYRWQESVDAIFSSPVTLTNTGIYSNATTATLNISDNTNVNGRYYRAIVSNSGGADTSAVVLLTASGPVLPSAAINATHAVNTFNNLYYGASCSLIAKVVPSGASPVTGNITADVWVQPSVPTVATQPFVQRHYQLTPSVNPATATATVILYFSQAEFDAYNASPGSSFDLPANPSDNSGKANLRIGKYGGSSNNGSGLPGSYILPASIINPTDANITWNAVTNMWEVSFDVAGFSGFIVHTSDVTLPVKLISFSAQSSSTNVLINWKTSEETNNDHFELERSTDGRNFVQVTSVNAIAGNGEKNYDHTDVNAALSNAPKLYYRLKMVSISGAAEYSNTIVVFLRSSNQIVRSIGPNPFRDKLDINISMPANGRVSVGLTTIDGRKLVRETRQVAKGFSTWTVSRVVLPAGVYLLTVEHDGELYLYKVIRY